MELGPVSEEVDVSASTTELSYVSPEIGHVVEAVQLVNGPVVASNSRGRSPVLAKLVPGVTSTSNTNSNINNFSFGGGRPVTNEIMVDGLPTTNPSDQTRIPTPGFSRRVKVLTTRFRRNMVTRGTWQPSGLTPLPAIRSRYRPVERRQLELPFSLQADIEHRWKGGFLIQASYYTFSKLIDDVDGPSRTNAVAAQDYYNLRLDRGVGEYDIPHRFVVSYVHEIPVGRHGKILKSMLVVNCVLDGWSFSGITEFQSGQPLAVTQPLNCGGCTSQRPTIKPRADPTLRAISRPSIAGSTPMPGPSLRNTSWALLRAFHCTGRASTTGTSR
jgi:hypothetical protein